MPDRLDQLYDALKADGAVSKSRENFRNYMLAPGEEGYKNRNELYKALKADGAVQSGTYEEFRNKLGIGAAKPGNSRARQQVAGQLERQKAASAAAQMQPAESTNVPIARRPEGWGGTASAPTMPWENPEEVQKRREESYGWTDTLAGQAKKNQDTLAHKAVQGNAGANKVIGTDRTMQQYKDRLDYYNATGEELKNPLDTRTSAEVEEQEMNGVTTINDLMAPTVERDEQGNMVMGADGSPLIGTTTDENRVATQRMERKRLSLEDQKRQAEEELLRLREEMSKIDTDYNPYTDSLSPFADPRTTNGDLASLSQAYEQTRERIKGLETELAGGQHGFLDGVLSAATDKSTWLLGLDKTGDTLNMLRVSEKVKNGEELTDAEKQMLGATLANQEVQGRLDEDSDWMYRTGRMTAEMVPFMAQIFATGGYGGVAAVGTKAGQSMAQKLVARYGTDTLLKRVAANVLKATGTAFGDVAAGFASANTTGLGNTINDALERRIGDLQLGENGEYNFVNDEDWFRAIMKAEVSQTKEFATERFGEHLPNLRQMNVWFAKSGATARKIARALSGAAGTNVMQKTAAFLRKGGINGVGGEIIEEEIGLPIDVAIGDMTWEEALGKENQWDIIGGMLLSMGAMHATGAVAQGTAKGVDKVYNTAQYYKYKRRADKAGAGAAAVIGNRWGEMRDQIDGTSNEDMNSLWETVRDDQTMSNAQKRAVFNYMNALTVMRGYNMGSLVAAKEKIDEARETNAPDVTAVETPAEADEVNRMAAEDAGYNLATAEEKRDAKNMMDLQRQRVEEMSDAQMTQNLDTDPIGTLRWIRENYGSEEGGLLERAVDYVNAASTYRGMIERVRDDIDAAVEQSGREIDEMTNENGTIIPITMKDDRQAHVISGNVVMFEDGSGIDKAKSDESIIIRDANGKLEMVAPDDILSMGDVQNAQQAKQEEAERITEEMTEQAGNEIEGTLSFNAGDVYQLEYDGQPHQVEIVQDNGDQTVSVRIDGSQEAVPMAKEQLQQMYDQQQQARVANMVAENNEADEAAAEPQPAENETQQEEAQETQAQEQQTQPAQAQQGSIPVDEQGVPQYEQASPDVTYDTLVGQIGEEATAEVARQTISEAQARLKELESRPIEGATVQEKVASAQAIQQERAAAQNTIDYWSNVLGVPAVRQAAMEEAAAQAEQAQPEVTEEPAAVQQDTRPLTEQTIEAAEEAQPIEEAQPVEATEEAQPIETEMADETEASETEVAETESTDAAAKPWGAREEKRRQKLRERAKKWVKGSTVKVRLIETVDDVPNPRAAEAIRRGMRVKGWFDPETGEAFIYLPHIRNERDFDKTYVHEVVSHKGMRALLGEEGYNDLCDKVFDAMTEEEQLTWMNYPGVNTLTGAERRRGAADEYIAHLAEDTNVNPNLWNKFVEWLKDAIRNIKGVELDATTKEITDLLRDSFQNMAEVNKANAQKKVNAESAGQMQNGQPIRFSTSSIIEGAGFEVEVDDDGHKSPLTDEAGNVIVRMNGKTFSASNPVTAADLNADKNSTLNILLSLAQKKSTISAEKADIIRQKYADIINMYLNIGTAENGGVTELQKNWLWLGETVFRTIATNGDKQYSYSADITRVCKKNEAVIRAISALQKEQGYGATPAQIMDIYSSTHEEGYQVPCPVCYVFSRYLRNGKYASAAINGMRKYGNHLPNGSEPWTAEQWEAELRRLEDQKKDKKIEAAVAKANEDISLILDAIDKRGLKLLDPKTKAAEKKKLRAEVIALDRQYRAALDVSNQQSLTNWIKTFAIRSIGDKWEIRPDAQLPENMQEFEENALDLRRVAETMTKYPAIQRLRKSGGAAAGKEITFESNNELGELISGVGTSDPSSSINWFKAASDATTDEEREEALRKAEERFDKAVLYAKRQSLRGGQRMWSWSDNIESLAPDVAVNLMQMEMLGGALQSYSKQLEGVAMVAAMDGYVNGSLIGKDNGWQEVTDDDVEMRDGKPVLKKAITDTITEPQVSEAPRERERVLAEAGSPIYEEGGKKYVLIFDDVIGIDPYGREEGGKHKKGLFDINRTFSRAGNILVGMNDRHVRAAMTDPRIYFIIPWHASGQSVHILKSMLGILGQNLTNFKPVDYTAMQEEKNYGKKNSEGKYPKVPTKVVDIWESHKNETDYPSGIGTIPSGDGHGGLSKKQFAYRELRKAIFDGSVTPEQQRQIDADAFLSQVSRKVRENAGTMTSTDNEFVYPYEYWDEGSTYDNADVNGARYAEYCRRLGICPKFSGKWGNGGKWTDEGNFIDEPGYWKLLIDRRMYDVNGNFQDLTPTNSDGFSTDLVDPAKTQEEYVSTQVADDEGTKRIVSNVLDVERKRAALAGRELPQANYDMNLNDAVKAYNKTRSGIRFRVTPEEDAEYMEAVNSGDIKKAQRMVKEAAGRAMPNTKVVDDDENPMVVYHGTDLNAVNGGEPFYHFYEDSHFGTFQQAENVMYGSPMVGARARNPKLYEVYLNITNPKRVEDVPEDWGDTHSEYWEPIIRQAKEEGYDGIVYENKWEGEGDSYIAFRPEQIKSALPVNRDDEGNVIPLSERFNDENNDIRFALGGEIGASNSPELQRNLDIAKEMEKGGKDAKAIWLATGWEKGNDGKWRYEIPDAKAKEVDPTKAKSIEDIVDAPELFATYPQLKDYEVKFEKMKGAGSFNHAKKIIRLDADYNLDYVVPEASKEEMKRLEDNFFYNSYPSAARLWNYSKKLRKLYGKPVISEEGLRTIVHELQHAIQSIEGFARGGNETNEADIYMRDRAEDEATYIFATKLAAYNTEKALVKLGRTKMIGMLERGMDGFAENVKPGAAELIDKLRGMTDSEYAAYVKRVKRSVANAKKAGSRNYSNLSGEVEARNVEARTKMSEEERRNTPPSETESVGRGDQIVRFSVEAEHKPFSLSEKERDEEGNRMYERNGSINLWNVSRLLSLARRQDAPIRLSERNMEHIRANHSDILTTEKDVFDFLDNVFLNAKKLRRARGRAMFVVAENENTDSVAIIKLMPSASGDYYNIDSAGIYRKTKWKESEDVIADLSEPSQSDAATDASKPQFRNKNGSGMINAEAQTQPSDYKGIKKSETSKENPEKISEKDRILFSIAWHGSPADFTEFEEGHYREGVGSFHRPGFYFASDEKSAKPYAYDRGNGAFLYEVELPDDNGTNYLHVYKSIPKSQRRELAKKIDELFPEKQINTESQIVNKNIAGEDLMRMFDNDELQKLGFVGATGPMYMATMPQQQYIMFNPKDIKITNKRNLSEGNIRFSVENVNQEVFVSNALRAVDGIKQEKATGEQWLAMLQKNGGLKAGEDKWLGLSDWLKEQASAKHSPTKKELQDFIREHQIRIEDVKYSEYDENATQRLEELNEEFDKLEDESRKKKAAVNEEVQAINNEMLEKYGEGWASNLDRLSDEDRERVDDVDWRYEDLADPADKAWRELVEKYGEDFELGFELNYGSMAIEEKTDWDGNTADYAKWFLGGGNTIHDTRLKYTTDGLDNKREIALTVPTIEPYNEDDTVHFGDAGEGRAVAWIRFGDTTDSDGNKTLVIDEIQSKRHQDGREKGYKDYKAYKNWVDYRKHLSEKYPNGWNPSVMTEEEMEKLESLRAEAYDKGRDLIPDAPFEKNWHELAMKRMLRLAAEEGYDKVAWTKGEQQAERYSLRKVIPSITRQDTKGAAKKGVRVFAMDINGEHEKFFVNNDGIIVTTTMFVSDADGKRLSDFFGKEMAVRMMAMNDGETIDTSKEKIGGEGMKGFYDEILPRFMNKYGKKWGVKVGEVELPNLEQAGRKMWSVDVTPEMKESVMQGQVMFRVSGELDEQYPTWLSGQTTSTGQHTTQITSTVKTYRRIGDWMEKEGMKDAKVLDASSGLGTGTQALREMGFDVDDVEPYPSKDREAPTFTKYDDINGTYDVVISNAVLNVIPDDWRRDVLHSMADKVKDGGKLIINVRDAKSIENQKQKIELDSPSEILVTDSKGNIRAYQKGFTRPELKKYVEDELGEGWQVDIANESNSGIKSGTAVVATRTSGAQYREGSEATETQPRTRRESKRERESREAYARRQWERAKETAEEWTSKLGLDAITDVYDTIDDVPGNKNFSKKKRRAKGWYDTKTGRIVIVMDNHRSPEDVLQTILHEGVAHYGLRQLFGDRLDTFLDNVYKNATADVRSRINATLGRNGWDHLKATEEYLARLAENTDFERAMQSGWWGKIKRAFLDMLRELGLRNGGREDIISDNELRYILWRSYENLAEPGRYRNPFKAAENTAMEVALNVGNNAAPAIPADEDSQLDAIAAELGISRNMTNRIAEEGIKGRVSRMGLREAQEMYNRLNSLMLDDDMLDIDEHLDKAKADWMHEHGREGVGKAMVDALDEVSDKYGSGMVTLRWELLDRIEELGGNDPDNNPGGLRFRVDGEEEGEDEDYDAGQMTFAETVTNGLLNLAEKNRDNVQLRTDAMRSIGGHLGKLRQAMARQREYDKGTVDRIVRLAKMVMQNGHFDKFSKYEVNRLMSLIKNAAGKEDITKQATAVVDLLMNHQLKEMKAILTSLMKQKTSKVNDSGVEVQAGLDVDGARMVNAFKKAIKLSREALTDLMGNTTDRMASSDEAVADNATVEYMGLQLAQQYFDEIKDSEDEEKLLKEELKTAKEDYDAGRMTREAYKQFEKATQDAIRENRLERTEAYERMIRSFGDGIRESVERAKEYREQEQARVNEIHHNANSDLQGVPTDEHRQLSWEQKVANWPLVRFFMKPLATFDEMLRFFGSKSVDGKGYLWNRFMGGWTEANDKEWRNVKAAHEELDAKVSEVMGRKMRWSDLFSMERKMDTIPVEFWDGDGMKDHELTQGNLLYIYMVNKMADGRMKLRKMGITEEDVEYITDHIDPRFKELADWLQDDFLVRKRNEYNAVHERMFGASMAAIENYFPLKINARSRGQEVEISNALYNETTPSTITGSIIKRKRNAIALDVTGADAFDVVLEHIQQMEHWAAFAEFNRDLKTLLNYKRFQNRVKNMSSPRFGAGKVLWKNFEACCAIAAGSYDKQLPLDSLDTAIVNIAKGVTAAKIAFRIFTAMKQLLSYPAYFSEASITELAKSTNPIGAVKAWNWAKQNLPGYSKRWQSRQAGDTRLKETDVDWQYWKNKIVETAGRLGMTPNAFVDALTVAMGAKAIYETKYKRYINGGYSEEDANKKALQDASIAYNETQQSSEGAFTSAMQSDRTVASVALTVFRNASMAYERKLLRALANLKKKMKRGYKEESIEYMTKQMVREGLEENIARANAERVYRRSWIEDVANTAIFGFVMQFAWNLGPYMAYLLAGDDDDEKKDMLEDASLHALLGGSVEGLSGGAQMSEIINLFRQFATEDDKKDAASLKRKLKDYNFNLLPLMSDLQQVMGKVLTGENGALNDVVNLVVQSGVGVNPQTITDAVVAIVDACDGDPETSREAAFLLMRIMQVPQSAIDKLFIDEIGMSAGEAKKLDAGELARRYARYKFNKAAPLTNGFYSDAERKEMEEKYVKRFENMLKERLSKLDNEDLESSFDSDDDTVRKYAGKEAAKRMGSQDYYGSSTSEYGLIYQRIRTFDDLNEDVQLQIEQRRAKEDGDEDREKEIKSMRNYLTTIKKDLVDGNQKEVMEELRRERKKMLREARELRAERRRRD